MALCARQKTSIDECRSSTECQEAHHQLYDRREDRVTLDEGEDQYSRIGHQLSHTYLADGALAHPCSSQNFTLSRVVVLKS
jgi:hypothetical protein